jgi:hypothetical protein
VVDEHAELAPGTGLELGGDRGQVVDPFQVAGVAAAAIDPDAVRRGPAGAAVFGRMSRTRWPSSRKRPGSGNARRLPCRSSSVTASFS